MSGRIDRFGIDRRRVVHAIARTLLALVFLYHGLITKLVARDATELLLVTDAGFSDASASRVVVAAGVLEIGIAIALVVFRSRAWPPVACIVLLVLLLAGVAIVSPRFLTAAFNPVSLNLSLAGLAVIDLLSLEGSRSWATMRGRGVP